MIECNCGLCQIRKNKTPVEELLDALKVMVLDRRHRAWLEENDPKALEQAERAIARIERQYGCAKAEK